ncbi:MAG: glutamine amidotransferase [Eggerthellaceae bacterium]|nr:glutamine amidotransferase [Eggerthellaceae bacterium]
MKPFVIAYIYPELLNLYGDTGNVTALSRRLEWRNIPVEVRHIHVEENIDFSEIDILYLGGGGDHEQEIANTKLAQYKDDLKLFASQGGVIFAACGGYHMLGNSFCLNGNIVEGLGVVDIETSCSKQRYVGNAWMYMKQQTLIGFVNHQTSTTYGADVTPLGYAFGPAYPHQKDACAEGVAVKNVFGTNFHGPLLPRNPKFTDYILKRALGQRGESQELLELQGDELEEKAAKYLWDRFDMSRYSQTK